MSALRHSLSGKVIWVTGAGKGLGRAVGFPLSDASSCVTGATLAVDGGWQAW